MYPRSREGEKARRARSELGLPNERVRAKIIGVMPVRRRLDLRDLNKSGTGRQRRWSVGMETAY